MKKLLILLFSILISFNSYGEAWKEVASEADGSIPYIDVSTIKVDKGYVYYWALNDFKTSIDGIMSMKTYYQGDCSNYRIKFLSDIYYKKPMGTDESSSYNVASGWEDVNTYSLNGSLLSYACDSKVKKKVEEKKNKKIAEENRKKSEDAKKAELKKKRDAITKELQRKEAELQRKEAEKKKASELAITNKKIAAEKELNKKIALIPPKTELQEAQNFLNNVQLFVKKNNTEFDIFEVTEFVINTKPILNGSFKDKDKKNLETFKKYTNNSSKFKQFIKLQSNLEQNREIQKIDKALQVIYSNLKGNFVDLNKWTKEVEKFWFDKYTKTHSGLVEAVKFTTLMADNEVNRQKQLKIANKYILDLTLYLSENMTSDLAPKVMSNLKKIKNATQDENQLKVLEKYDNAGMKGETIAMYLEKINDEINLFIRNNIPQIKVETQVPKIKTYANSSASYSQLNRQVGCKSDYSAEKKGISLTQIIEII